MDKLYIQVDDVSGVYTNDIKSCVKLLGTCNDIKYEYLISLTTVDSVEEVYKNKQYYIDKLFDKLKDRVI